MKDLVRGVCGEIISNPSSPCPYCGAEPNHFIPAEGVDRELLRKLCREGRTDLLTGAVSPPAKPAVSGFPPGDSGFRRDGLDMPGPRTAPPGLKPGPRGERSHASGPAVFPAPLRDGRSGSASFAPGLTPADACVMQEGKLS